MLTPATIDILTYFYPFGDTPAVCLTRDLPREQEADILLLGCGDVRNILFTSYADTGLETRRVDITCCDNQKAILARNILLFSLVLDDKKGSNDDCIWNIYYHLFLDENSLNLLEDQAKKLCAFSSSVADWHSSKYGRLLRICDQGTLTKLRKIWSSHSTSGLPKKEKADYDRRFKSDFQKACGIRRHQLDRKVFGPVEIFQSAAPVGIESLGELLQLNQYYWRHGTTAEDPGSLSEHRLPNPMFASSVTDTSVLHYKIDPLLGFHLATAFAPLTAESPLQSPGTTQRQKLMAAARGQFQAWSISFRRWLLQNKTLRFFAGDALSFCYTLQHMRIARDDVLAHCYRGQYGLEPLILDSKDYTAKGKGPLLFDVIDTSNLVDELGGINVLVATSSLLKESTSSSIHTESYPPQDGQSHMVWMENLLSGHPLTVSILLGLVSVESWTSATVVSTNEELLKIQKGLNFRRLTWKRLVSEPKEMPQKTTKISFDEGDLTHILHEIYAHMFWHMNVRKAEDGSMYCQGDLPPLRKDANPPYNGGSFASFLRCVKGRVKVDWNRVMNDLLNEIAKDSRVKIAGDYLHELYVQLHILGVHSEPISHPPVDLGIEMADMWNLSEPKVIYITIKIPRAKLGILTNLATKEIGIPLVQCVIRIPFWESIFEVLQLAFGDVTTSGPRDSKDFRVHLAEDEHGWAGRSALIVSFCAPAWVMHFPEPQVAFKIRPIQMGTRMLAKTLGSQMKVYQTSLYDHDSVYIASDRPNLEGKPAVCDFVGAHAETNEFRFPGNSIHTTLTANVERKDQRIVSLIRRYVFLSKDVQMYFRDWLADHQPAVSVQISPCTIVVFFGNNGRGYLFPFPVPVLGLPIGARMDDECTYMKMEAPLAESLEDRFLHAMYPLSMDSRDPVLWNTPHLKLDILPIVDIAQHCRLKWLSSHIQSMFVASGQVDRPSVRKTFKDGLHTIFCAFRHGQRVFGINNPKNGGLHIILFVSCLRLDVENLTVVLDSAILPLTKQMLPQVHGCLAENPETAMTFLDVDDCVLLYWKTLLRTMVERCRQWEHLSSCEYRRQSQIHLKIDFGVYRMCSCGNGRLSPNFIPGVPLWNLVLKDAVRAAIAPSFSVHCAEDTLEDMLVQDESKDPPLKKPIADGGAGGSAEKEPFSVHCAEDTLVQDKSQGPS